MAKPSSQKRSIASWPRASAHSNSFSSTTAPRTPGSAIARRYAETHPDRVRYIDHPQHANRGMSASRNAGISVARGDLIAFIDADDVWLPDKLRDQVLIFDAHPQVGLVAGATLYWDSWQGGEDRTVLVGHVQNRVFGPPGALLSLYPLGKAPAPCPSCLLVRRSVVEGVGGFEASYIGRLQMYEDQAFLAKVYLRTPVYLSDRTWFKYRQHDSSCVAENIKDGHYDAVREHFLAWFARHLTEAGFTDSKVWRKLWVADWPYRHPRLHGTLWPIYLTTRGVWRGMKRRWSLLRGLAQKFRIAMDKAAKGISLSVDEQNVIDVLKEAEARTAGRRVIHFPISFPLCWSGFPEDVARFIYKSAMGREIEGNWPDYEAMFPNLVGEASRVHTKQPKNLVGPSAHYARFRDDIAHAFVRFASRPLGDWSGWDFPLRPEELRANS